MIQTVKKKMRINTRIKQKIKIKDLKMIQIYLACRFSFKIALK